MESAGLEIYSNLLSEIAINTWENVDFQAGTVINTWENTKNDQKKHPKLLQNRLQGAPGTPWGPLWKLASLLDLFLDRF